MGWDLLIIDGRDLPSLDGTSSDWIPAPLGPADEVRARISVVIPSVDWSDPHWGLYLTSDFSIEFSIQEDPVEAIGVHVHGGGDPVSPLVALCRAQRMAAFDISKSEFLDLDDPSTAGWTAFCAYRDEVLREGEPPAS